jgi:hypothetical protein
LTGLVKDWFTGCRVNDRLTAYISSYLTTPAALHCGQIAALKYGITTMLIKLLFKKQEAYPDDIKALIDVSVSLRVRMDKIVHNYDAGQFGSLESLAA